MASGDNILVAIKSRPLISRETSQKLRPQWAVQDENIFQIDEEGHRLSEPYSFDHIFTEYMTNSNVYDAIVEPLVKSFLNGFNSTIFAYGQTSSGKTHTMMGTHSNPGIIQMAINDVFHHVSHDEYRRYLISCSYFEIYNEKINDLLDKNGKDLKIREDFCGNTFVNAKEEVVTKAAQVYELMKTGGKIRKIGCTNMNDRSSRSHTIFRLTIKSTENNIEHGPVQISYLNLVDLAGSERIAHTNAAGVRLKEGVNINKSLLALGNVIRQLSEGEGYINYRDSNLTRLLQHALGGNAKSLIIATITIAAGEETKSTLEFAQRAKVVKNKPVINEILSEQDKLKQYELVTERYKGRLEKEKQRIQEMEQEKEEREREILKLKQQVKLIDLFTNGPERRTVESKIPRRHTMGHYTSRIPLQTIPESRVLPSNIMPEKSVESCAEINLDEELFVKRASQISDYDYMKTVLEESLDDGVLAVTPEPSDELLVQEETTPASHLRERLKLLEESYISLREFTKLETKCQEDKNIVFDLVKEKENLLKDLVDINIIVKDMKKENQQMKIQFEEELSTLRNELEYAKNKSDKFSFALDKAEAEKDAFGLSKEQLLNDNAVLLEQQKLKYENRIEYLIKEIEKLHEQENQTVDYNLEEMQKLRIKKEDFKSNIEKITIYEERIKQLEEKLQRFESEEKEDFDVLSVSTQTEEITQEAKDTVTEELNEKMRNLSNKLEDMHSLNLVLQDELREYKEKDCLVLKMEIANTDMKNEIAQKQKEIDILLTKIQNLEKEIPLKDDQIIDLKSKLDAIQIEQSENVADLVSYKDDIELKISEITVLGEKLLKLTDKINDLENCNHSNKELIQARDNKILQMASQIKDLENNNKEEIKMRDNIISELKSTLKEQFLKATSEIQRLENDISHYKNDIQSKDETEIDNSNMKNDIAQKQEEIDILLTKIQNLEKEILLKDGQIIDLKSKLDVIQIEIELKIGELTVVREKILQLTDKISDLEKCNNSNKEQIQARDNRILEMSNRVKDLENHNKEEIKTRDNLISELKSTVRTLEEQFLKAATKIQNLENDVSRYKNDIQSREMDNHKMKNDIVQKQKKIDVLLTKIQNLEKEIPLKDDQIIDLKSKLDAIQIEQTENVADLVSYKNEIELKISEITVLRKKIIQLTDKINDLEKCNNSNKGQIQMSDNKVLEMANRIKDLENHNNKEIKTRDNLILELKSTVQTLEKQFWKATIDIQNLETDISRYKNYIQSRDETILELQNRISKLDEACHNYEHQENKKNQELENRIKSMYLDNTSLKAKIFELENIITELKSSALDVPNASETKNARHSSASSSSLDLSPKELRRRKRQSIHDQRRGIDFTATDAAACGGAEESDRTKKDLKEKIKELEEKVEYLASENASLESEVQGFIRELDDCRKYRDERDSEIDVLTEQIEKMKKGQVQEDCKECPRMQQHIKQLEKLKKQNAFKIVELQTRIYDLQNVRQQEKANTEERERRLTYDIKQLEIKLGDRPLPQLKDAEIQCELTNIGELLEKYSKVKKLARMRREEGNILRARLGMSFDEPVT